MIFGVCDQCGDIRMAYSTLSIEGKPEQEPVDGLFCMRCLHKIKVASYEKKQEEKL